MKAKSKKQATHRTPRKAARLATPKSNPTAKPKTEVHKTIRAESFHLVDSEGRTLAELASYPGISGTEEAALVMRDRQGRLRLTLRAGEENAMFTVFGERSPADEAMEDRVPRMEIGYDRRGRKATPRVVIFDGDENQRVSLSIDGDGGGILEVENGESCACIDERGLIILDDVNEVLATYQATKRAEAKPAHKHKPESFSPTAPINLTGGYVNRQEIERQLREADEKYGDHIQAVLDLCSKFESQPDGIARYERAIAALERIADDEGYDPEIEARRADYERLAEELSHMIDLQGDVTDLLDLKTFGANDGDTFLMDGIVGHLRALWDNMNWHDPRTMRRFYPEMRLWIARNDPEFKRRSEEREVA